MRAVFVVFPGLTALDFVGLYDPLSRIRPLGIDRHFELRITGTVAEIADGRGLVLKPDSVYLDLSPFDLLLLPGGLATRTLMHDKHFIGYLRTWGWDRPVASVCTGALLLASAGLLRGAPATTNQSAFDLLRGYDVDVVTRRVVDIGRVITAGGVSAALDLGLYLVERYYGVEARRQVAQQMEYRGYPDELAESGAALMSAAQAENLPL
jgi:transcriptional regulator GlxA family with amidase domain